MSQQYEASSTPGFRSLSEAGIQLKEGERLPVNEAMSQTIANQVRAESEDPNWPPMPTMANGEQEPEPGPPTEEKGGGAKVVAVQPRTPGTKRPLPHQLGNNIPAGYYVGQLPQLQFSCPCCGVVLTITEPQTYRGQPGPCPNCAAVVMPPQLVSPFAVAQPNVPVPGAQQQAPGPQTKTVRHFSGFMV